MSDGIVTHELRKTFPAHARLLRWPGRRPRCDPTVAVAGHSPT